MIWTSCEFSRASYVRIGIEVLWKADEDKSYNNIIILHSNLCLYLHDHINHSGKAQRMPRRKVSSADAVLHALHTHNSPPRARTRSDPSGFTSMHRKVLLCFKKCKGHSRTLRPVHTIFSGHDQSPHSTPLPRNAHLNRNGRYLHNIFCAVLLI